MQVGGRMPSMYEAQACKQASKRAAAVLVSCQFAVCKYMLVLHCE